jgi:hypothetical protein
MCVCVCVLECAFRCDAGSLNVDDRVVEGCLLRS